MFHNHRGIDTLSSRFMFTSLYDRKSVIQKVGEGDFSPTLERRWPRQKHGEEFAQGHQWINTSWTWDRISKTLRLVHFFGFFGGFWLALLENSCAFRWCEIPVKMQIPILQIWLWEGWESVFLKSSQKILRLLAQDCQGLGIVKVSNWLPQSLAFLMPWC